jgi:hypothetical protein
LSTSLVLFVIVAALVLVAVAAMLRLRPNANQDGFPYEKSGALFSPAERSFLGVLDQAVGTDFRIFGKVRIADVISVRRNPNRSAWQRAFNRISAKHFDFVLCEPGTLSVACVVELDDKSHSRGGREIRDKIVVDVCKAAALPLLQVQARSAYAVGEIGNAVRQLLDTADPTKGPESAN